MLSAVQAILLIRRKISGCQTFPELESETLQDIEAICEASIKGVNVNYWREKYDQIK